MRRRDKSDRWNSFWKYIDNLIQNLFKAHLQVYFRWDALTDFMILTIDTMKIASAKKDIANASLSADNRLLSPVDTDCCNIQSCICTAIAISSFKPVNTALSWTQGTILKNWPVASFIYICLFHSDHWNILSVLCKFYIICKDLNVCWFSSYVFEPQA